MKFPYGIHGSDLKEYVVKHGGPSAEKNLEIYEKWFRKSPRYLFKAVDKNYQLTKKVFCDIGCSYGMNLVWSRAESYGVDIVPEYTEFAQNLGLTAYTRDVITADLSDLPKVEAVWCCAVLEHVDAPHIFLRKLWTLLEPNGMIFMWVPTIPPAPWRYLRHVPFLKRHLTAHTHSDHVNAFTPSTVRFMAERAGFDTIELNALYPKPFGWLGRFIFILDGVMYIGKKKESAYFGNSSRIGRAEYFDTQSSK
ncbi:MAG: glycosyl transferase family 2 [Candidatus Kaiserbacteria bacterium]|nr:glycosyl transferase family 2 [Candidatus Kaiserbacteria bacterium]